MPSTILILSGLLVFSLASNLIQMFLFSREREKWMRMFSFQQGIPLINMGVKEEKKIVAQFPKKERFKISVPIPGAQMFRKQ